MDEMIAEWRECGVAKGDMLLLHSSIRRTLQRHTATPETVLESFLSAIGSTGTLILPLFNFDFTKGVPFDIKTTLSQMGALTEAGRNHPLAIRTGHPIYSFAVIGAKRHLFETVCNESGYADDSPFGILRHNGGKIAVLDLPDQNSMTYYHHVEEVCGIDYRYFKNFTGPYRGIDQDMVQRTFRLFVRDIERGVQTHVDPMGEKLWDLGLYRGARPKEGPGLRTISAQAMFDAVASVIHAGKAEGLLFRLDR